MGDCNGQISPQLDRTSDKNIKITQGKLSKVLLKIYSLIHRFTVWTGENLTVQVLTKDLRAVNVASEYIGSCT